MGLLLGCILTMIITKNTQDLPRTSLGILLPVTPFIFLRLNPDIINLVLEDKVSPPVPGGPGTQRQHCRRDLTSRCKTLVRRHSPRSWTSPPQFLRIYMRVFYLIFEKQTWEKLTCVLVKLVGSKMPGEGNAVLVLNTEQLARLSWGNVRVDSSGGLGNDRH